MKTAVLFVAFAMAMAVAAAGSVPFTNCGSGPVTVSTVTVDGDLKPGSTVKLGATATTTEAIKGGSFDLEVKFIGITVLTKTGNLCSSDYFHIGCPVAVGPVTGAGSVDIPSAVPAGSYTVQISAKNEAGDELFCVSVAISIGSSTTEVDEKQPAAHKFLVEAVNNHPKATWTAEMPERFAGKTLAYAKQLCGTYKGALTKLPLSTAPVADALPSSFDSRSNPKWDSCATRLSHVRDQADCGSCWAFGSTEAFNDRLCISTNGAMQTELSAQDTTSCCTLFTGCGFSQGCQGGDPTAAWSYFVSTGVVTGGDYDTIGSGSTCFPYQLANCAHHEPSKFANCSATIAPTPACPNPKACSEKSYGTAWANDKHFAKSAYSLGSVEQIMTDIMTYGPVTAAFTVYQDFLTYRKGVYKHLQGPELGGHAVKIIGWGEENGEAYWTVANSWNKYWGDDGFFKIARGVDECGIEDDVSAGHT